MCISRRICPLLKWAEAMCCVGMRVDNAATSLRRSRMRRDHDFRS